MKRTTWNLFSGRQLTFGPGAVGTLTGYLGRRQRQRALLVCDNELRECGVLAMAEQAVKISNCESKSFTDGETEPSAATVGTLVDFARQFEPDVLIAVGGGSNMDLAKACNAVLTSGRSLDSLFGHDLVSGPLTPLVCLPTTAGTGSEVTHSAIVRREADGAKDAILSQCIRPDVAIVDPQLTISCPPKVTAESGFDALTHAIEAYLVQNFFGFAEDFEHGLPYEGNHPLGDLYAEKAIALIAGNLARAVDDPDNLAARSAMALAATLAGMAFSSCGVSLAHALEYPIGEKYKCSHGAGNAIVLPSVLRYWLPSRQARIAKIATLFGVADAVSMSQQDAADRAIDSIEQLRAAIGLPSKIRDVGGQPDDLDGLSEVAVSLERLTDLSPRRPSREDLQGILKASM